MRWAQPASGCRQPRRRRLEARKPCRLRPPLASLASLRPEPSSSSSSAARGPMMIQGPERAGASRLLCRQPRRTAAASAPRNRKPPQVDMGPAAATRWREFRSRLIKPSSGRANARDSSRDVGQEVAMEVWPGRRSHPAARARGDARAQLAHAYFMMWIRLGRVPVRQYLLAQAGAPEPDLVRQAVAAGGGVTGGGAGKVVPRGGEARREGGRRVRPEGSANRPGVLRHRPGHRRPI